MKNPSESLELKFISEIKKKANTITGGDRERSVEDFFVSFFDGIPGFKASRADAPRLKYHKTLYTDGIVSFNNEIFSVFEFKKDAIKFTSNNELLFNQEENVVYAQAIKYILCSNSEKFASELKFNKVLLFNGGMTPFSRPSEGEGGSVNSFSQPSPSPSGENMMPSAIPPR